MVVVVVVVESSRSNNCLRFAHPAGPSVCRFLGSVVSFRFYFFLLSVIVLVPFGERVGSALGVIWEPRGGCGGEGDP